MRELKNAVESAAVLAPGETIDHTVDEGAEALTIVPSHTREPAGDGELRISLSSSLAEVERRVILAHVQRGASRRDAARSLGIGLRTLYTKLRGYE